MSATLDDDVPGEGGPHICVVTINFNNREGLRRTLLSVDQQIGTEWQSISVDAASSDGSVQVLEEFAVRSRFEFTSEPDKGIYDAMNKGWTRTTAPLIVFLNSGDAFARRDVLATMVTAHKRQMFRWGYGCARLVQEGRSIGLMEMLPFRFEKLALGIRSIPHQAAVFERSLLEELGGFSIDIGLAADQDLMLRAALVAEPHLWAEFFVDFEAGGRGSIRGPAAFPLDMARARRAAKIKVSPWSLLDVVLTAAVIFSKSLRHRASLIYRGA